MTLGKKKKKKPHRKRKTRVVWCDEASYVIWSLEIPIQTLKPLK